MNAAKPENTARAVKVVLQRSYPAPVERVFDAWIIPTLLGNWMFGPRVRAEEIISLDNSPRVGGEFCYVVACNGQTIRHTGKFLELRRPEKLRFSWGIDNPEDATSTVTVTLRDEAGRSRLRLSHELLPDQAAYAEQVKLGWSRMLEALAALLQKQSGQRTLFRE